MSACTSCGTQIASDGRFCPSCGAAVVLGAASAPSDASQAAAPTEVQMAAPPPYQAAPPPPPYQAPPTYQPPPGGAVAAPASPLSVNNWMMLCHLSALAGIVIPSLGHIIGPLVVWLVKRGDIPEVDVEGKESLNFQLSMTIYAIVSSLFIWVLIGIPMLLAVALVDVVLTIVASLKTSQGTLYRYPFTIRFLK